MTSKQKTMPPPRDANLIFPPSLRAILVVVKLSKPQYTP